MEEVIDKGHVAVTWGEPVVWGLSDGYADECDDGLRERERGEWSVGFASRPCSWMYSSVPFYPLFSRRIFVSDGGAPESALELWPSLKTLRGRRTNHQMALVPWPRTLRRVPTSPPRRLDERA